MINEPKNEQTLCKMVIHLIGDRRGEAITDAESVDTVIRTRPAVDWQFETPTARFAVEHTRIESFPNQIGKGKKFAQLLEPLETELAGRLPGEFLLFVNVGAAKAPAAKHVAIRSALSEWILANAHSLEAKEEVDFWENSNCVLTAKLPNVPFDVTLSRDTSYGSRLFIIQEPQGNSQLLLHDCIRETLKRKCPKLSVEQATGRISVLILESDDIALADRKAIAEAAVAELSVRNDAPEIVLWARTSTQPWKAWFIKEGSFVHPRIKQAGPFNLTLS